MATRRVARRPRAAAPDADGSAGESTDPESAARNICLQLLTARPRSRAELATALGRKGVPSEVTDRVLDRLVEVGLVDDVSYAELVVQSGHRHRALGRRALSAELRRRGVADDTAGEAIAALDTGDEEQTARQLVERRLRAMSGLDDSTRIRRLVGMLARRGYPEGLAYRVVREALREQGSSAELPDPEHVT
ncbi:MAG: recombination regulator RecX [Actinomycetota bacterium]|nr:recombination regulator RecX [Actinomycetota bacterium]